jgi:GT2 family glycosyltransferase
MNIVAVVVTYNRLPLLKKCLSAVDNQTRKPDQVLVINNGSTDGTSEWLQTQPYSTYTFENMGGAAGFSNGIKQAYEAGADWIWVMDDDTIPNPDALERLEEALVYLKPNLKRVGFLSSRVLWTDGSIHNMNRILPMQDPQKLTAYTFTDKYSPVRNGTFVSMLIAAKAVEQVGLPFKEFFIWCDDVEYSKRIIKSGLSGLYVEDSVVIHETPTNHRSNVLKDPQGAIWKYEHGLRNELFMVRLHEGEVRFWYAWLKRMVVWPWHIVLKRKNHRWAFIKMVWKSSIKAILFYPTITKVMRQPTVKTTESITNKHSFLSMLLISNGVLQLVV